MLNMDINEQATICTALKMDDQMLGLLLTLDRFASLSSSQ